MGFPLRQSTAEQLPTHARLMAWPPACSRIARTEALEAQRLRTRSASACAIPSVSTCTANVSSPWKEGLDAARSLWDLESSKPTILFRDAREPKMYWASLRRQKSAAWSPFVPSHKAKKRCS
eukprot:scaffold68348_cov32-Tisochrysis_lutea.AAC.1